MLSGIAVCRKGMRPAEADAVLRRQFLGQECPGAVAGALVLELNERAHIAVHHFEDAADGGLGLESIQRRDLEGVFVRDIRVEGGQLSSIWETSCRPYGAC